MPIDQDAYPPEPWALRETRYARDSLPVSEALFALANGHLGLRGNLDEGEPRGITGTYLNGFYESYPLQYGERGFGFAEDGQAMVNVTDGKVIRLLVENEPVDVERGTLEDHERVLDFRTGLLERSFCWRSAQGKRIRVRSRRLVSFVQRSVAAIEYEVEAVDGPVRIGLQSKLQANEAPQEAKEDPRAGAALGDVLDHRLDTRHELRAVLAHTTKRSGLSMAAGMDHVLEGPGGERVSADGDEDWARVSLSVRLEPGERLKLTKFLAYHWSARQTPDWLRDQVDASLENALAEGFGGLARQQRAYLDDWWALADVEIEGDLELQQALRFALFHLLQAGARIEGRAIGCKGLTGPGYDGHAFWDTETFVLPVLTYLAPKVARDALAWRHSILPQARERAQQLGMTGAAFPWRTIHGEECSGYWPAGLAAMHVNADVADAVRRYLQATGDDAFAEEHGAELLVETARLWACVGAYDRDGLFRIDGVTGPDEYSALVDNNTYTNLMAQANLRAAAEACSRWPDAVRELGVTDEECAAWTRAADAMFVPRDEAIGVTAQDQSFTLHERWPFDDTAPEEYPLMLHHSYFDLYRKQVVKQADLVLALHLRGDHFDLEQKRRDFEYYEGVTVRDSSLSACTQSIVAAEVGHLGLAWQYLREAALVDLDDLGSNTAEGLHMASLGGSVQAVVAGLGGFRDWAGTWTFRPRLPEPLQRVRFGLGLSGTLLRVDVTRERARYEVLEGPPVTLVHWDEEVTVEHGSPVERPLPEPPELEPPAQPRHREAGRRAPQHREGTRRADHEA